MNLFGEPELGIDYIQRRASCGKLAKFFRVECTYCGKTIFRQKRCKGKIRVNSFCDSECYGLYLNESNCGDSNPQYMRTSHICKNPACNIIFTKTLSSNKQYCCPDCYFLCNSGSKSPAWKGGQTSKTMILRQSKEYQEWRTQVFERDDYTCQDCDQWGGDLEAHHLITVSENYDLIFDVDNGRTLCVPCHSIIKTHEIEYRETLNGQENQETQSLCHGLCL